MWRSVAAQEPAALAAPCLGGARWCRQITNGHTVPAQRAPRSTRRWPRLPVLQAPNNKKLSNYTPLVWARVPASRKKFRQVLHYPAKEIEGNCRHADSVPLALCAWTMIRGCASAACHKRISDATCAAAFYNRQMTHETHGLQHGGAEDQHTKQQRHRSRLSCTPGARRTCTACSTATFRQSSLLQPRPVPMHVCGSKAAASPHPGRFPPPTAHPPWTRSGAGRATP